MARYVDVDIVYELIQEQLDDVDSTGAFSQGMSKAFNIAKSILNDEEQVPTADVQEVRHGKWIRQDGRPEAICSECGRNVVYQVINYRWQFENYCPHCGAKMDGKD